MDEKKLLDMLKASGEDVPIPENLEPEQIRRKLMESDVKKKKQRKIRNRFGKLSYAAMAAAAVLVVGIGSWQLQRGRDEAGTAAAGIDQVSAADAAERINEDVNTETSVGEEIPVDPQAKAAFDQEYETAGSYEKLKELLEEYERRTQPEERNWFEQLFGGVFYEKSSDAAVTEESAGDYDINESASPMEPGEDYSGTNVQTEGVDEGDLVKTDGNYLYLLKNSRILIYDIQNKLPELVGQTPYILDSAAAQAIEMYVDGNRLVVLMQDNSPVVSADAANDNYYWVENQERTRIFVYDISDRTNPKETGSMDVDGSYQTSRRKGDYLYLFTNYFVCTDDSETGVRLPKAGNQTAEASDVYLPQMLQSEQCLIIAAIDLRNMEAVTDLKLVFTYGDDPYVSNSRIYLKKEEYGSVGTTTLIQFCFENGKITPGGAASVIGTIRDTFAINEYENTLRVLTTAWINEEQENFITVLDVNTMGLLGKAEGIAKGEEIYSARFLGTMGYFVTYRNMDPLFAVDFSDPANPQIISELKITGFSEYLHFWGEDKLIGIGYETDPEDGTQTGVKLSMFDISDPYHITEADKIVLTNCVYTSAATNYKGVLIDEKKDLIAFAVTDNWREENLNLMVYSYRENKAFRQLLAETVGSGTGDNLRSFYANDVLYVIGQTEIYAYDMTEGYSFLGKVAY